jgi:ubiquinone/menaquinone biosynthesis C-methylase UbiE
MTIDLSFRRANPMTREMETFYSALHRAMYSLADLRAAPFPTAREFREFLARRFPDGLSDRRCLDAGCGGTAVNTHSLFRAGARRVTCLDLNRESLLRAREGLRAAGLAVTRVIQASLLDIPAQEAAFDLVVCSGVVHHTPDPARGLRELRRVLRPGGTAYVSVYCFEDSWSLSAVRVWRTLAWVFPFRLAHALFRHVAAVNNFVLDHMYVPILWVFRAVEFRRLLEDAGFRVEESFRSSMDSFGDRRVLGRSISGDGLLRVFVCTRS